MTVQCQSDAPLLVLPLNYTTSNTNESVITTMEDVSLAVGGVTVADPDLRDMLTITVTALHG